MADKTPWPADAYMIVAPNGGQAIFHPSQPTTPRNCRLCGASVVVRVSSIETAMNDPLRMGRPIDFFCIACATQHDPKTVEVLRDMRKADGS